MAKFIKNLMMQELKREFSKEKDFIFITLASIDTRKTNELRQIIKNSGANMKVVKNTVAKKAFLELGLDKLDDFFKGQTSVIKGSKDVIQLVKNLSKWNQKEKKLKFKGGILDKKLLDSEAIESLSKLFGKDEALTKIHSSFKSLFYRIHWMFSSFLNRFVIDLKQYAQKKE